MFFSSTCTFLDQGKTPPPKKKEEREKMAPPAKSAAFEKAIVESRKLKTIPTQDELLEVNY